MKSIHVENKFLKRGIIFLMLTALLAVSILFTSCSNSEEVIQSDADLIAAIENATNRISITVEDLPATAQNDLGEGFSNDVIYSASSAANLGYEVKLVTAEGSWASEFNRAYYDTTGRQLEDRRRPRHGRRRSCFHVVFPFSVVMPDGTTINLESRADKSLIRAWYETNPDANEKPDLVFPIEIEYQDGTFAMISNQTELETARGECSTTRCFDLVYPFSVTMPDSTVITLNTEGDRSLIRAWYETNPGVHEKPELVFPVEIVYQDGTTQTINSEDELRVAKENCS